MTEVNEENRAGAPAIILVADDDPNDVFFLKRAFQKAGYDYRVLDVPDGETTLEYLRGDSNYADRIQFPLPDLLLLDLKMPKVNGFEVLSWLQREQQFNSMKVVVLSSSGLPSDKQKAQILGAHDYKVKPSDISEMLTLAKEIASRWLS